jgi:hypothetical protein
MQPFLTESAALKEMMAFAKLIRLLEKYAAPQLHLTTRVAVHGFTESNPNDKT